MKSSVHLFTWVLLLIGSKMVDSEDKVIECYHCPDVLNPRDCHSTTFCDEDHFCSTHFGPYGPSSELRYELGCTQKMVCAALANLDHHNMCYECCDTPACNNQLCNPPTTSTTQTPTSQHITTPPPTNASHTTLHYMHRPTVFIAQHTTGVLGQNVHLSCRYSGYPKPQISWYFNDKHIHSSQNPHILIHDSQLMIYNSELSDSGNYTCKAVNLQGQAAATTSLILTGAKPIFTERPPSHLNLMEASSTATLRCRARGNPDPSIHWSFHLTKHTVDVLSSFRTSQDQETLIISNPSTDLSGHITCSYSNAFGTISTNVSITVQTTVTTEMTTTPAAISHTTPVPIIINLSTNSEVKIGESISIPCDATGYPAPQITWSQVPNGFPSNVQQSGNKLMITNALPLNNRLYVCDARNMYGNAIKLIKVNVVGVPPTMTVSPGNQTVAFGDRVHLRCQASGKPQPTITWSWKPASSSTTFDEAGLKLVPGVVIDDTGLIIEHTQDVHKGEYVCVVSNAYGSITNDIFVTLMTTPANVPPHISANPLSSGVLYGDDITIHLSVTGEPTPSVVCLFKNQPVLPSNVHVSDNSVLLTKVTDSNSGQYSCMAHNTEGDDRVDINVQVIGMSPSFITKPVTQTVLFGTQSTFTCTAAGVPSPTITWEYRSVGGNINFPSGTTMNSNNTTLTIKSTQEAGTFTCHATNVYGQESTKAAIFVRTGQVIG